MKKIIGLTIAVLLIIGLVGGGTFAYFSDTETSTGNTLTAGTLNLQVGAADPVTDKVTLANIKPTDSGNAAIWLTKNTGSLQGTFSVAVSAITDNENTITEPEANAGDVSPTGELGGLVKIAMWMDIDKDGTWSSGDYYLDSSSSAKVAWSSGATLPAGAYFTVDSFGVKSFSSVQTVAATTDAGNFRIEYNFPNGGASDNVAQGDSSVFDITFTLEQI